MNLQALHGHTVDLDRLPEAPAVLDVGSRDYGFSRALLAVRPLAEIVALEPDPAVPSPWSLGLDRVHLHRVALVHDDRTESGYASYSTGEGNFLTEAASYYDAKMLRVPCTNIQQLMLDLGIDRWDAVKLDCEGCEFDILANWPGPIADQITVEFHDWTDPRRYGEAFYAALFERLPWYEPVQHKITPIGPGPSYGHWDSLLVRR